VRAVSFAAAHLPEGRALKALLSVPPGPPAPPQDVTVHAGATPATVQVSWKPPALTTAGLSNGANVSGYGVYAKGQRVAEVTSPMADSIAVELVRLRRLEAKGVTVRTLSAQGESTDSAPAAIPPDLLVPPTPHLRTPTPKPLASVGAPDTKDEHLGPHVAMDGAWEQSGAPAPAHGHMLEPPSLPGSGLGRRSPSPSRILPQPQGTPVSTSVAKAMAREAAQRVAESSRVRLGFSSLVCGGGCSRHWGCLGGRDAAWPPCARGLLSRPDPDGIKMYSQYVKMGPCTQRNCLSTSLAELRQQAVSGPVPRLCLC